MHSTHVTGLVTDIGIELGKIMYWNHDHAHKHEGEIASNRNKLRLHATLVGAFFVGGIAGAAGFKYLGFISTLPLALALLALSLAPRFKSRMHN
jgi:uncharacterized membrane protein YoaK (UPF0700 family)